MSLLQARGLSYSRDHYGWVPSPTSEDLLGDDFTSLGLTGNPGLGPSNLSKQHFVEVICYQKKNKKSFGFTKWPFSDPRKHIVKNPSQPFCWERALCHQSPRLERQSVEMLLQPWKL